MKNYTLLLLNSIYLLLAGLMIYYFDGTGDAGDSVQHYLLSRAAFTHPELFFDHWGKPVFILLSAPFAQLGFVGIKIFNVLVTLLTINLTVKVAEKITLPNAWLAALFCLVAPYFMVMIFSGLTEPLFALFLIAAFYLGFCRERWTWAVLLLSFMPFVRSEGMIICGVFGLYLLWKKEWKLLPLFAVGHLVYSVVGGLVLNDFLWIWNKNPYASLNAYVDDEAHLWDFADKLNYVIGIPLYGLFVIGLLSLFWKKYRNQFAQQLEILLLAVTCFFAFFLAHTFFWYFGVFNSMGLKRVLLGLIPMIGIIALMGFNAIQELTKKYKGLASFLFYGILIYLVVFPFTKNPAAIDWSNDMKLKPDQLLAQEVGDFVVSQKIAGPETIFYYTHPYLSVTLDVDHADFNRRRLLDQIRYNKVTANDIIIWDQWFAVTDNDFLLEDLIQDFQLKVIKDFQSNDFRYVVLKVE